MTALGETLIERAKGYLQAVATHENFDDVASFLTSDYRFDEYPNRVSPNGSVRDLAAAREGAARGRKLLASQRYDVLNAVAAPNHVILEVQWTGVLAIPVGTLPAGGEMRCKSAMFLDFRDDRIARQRNYDCFDPW
jgi:hypothetical protein